MNYFEFYDIAPSLKVDKEQLRQVYLKNSKKYHPDFFTLEDEEKQQEVLELSTLNNKAYKTLSDFDARMKYLLELKGILAEEGKNNIPQDFLLEMMDINEAIMELQFDFDQTAYDQAIQNIASLEETQFKTIESIVDTYNGDTDSNESLNKIKDYYLKKRYLLRIRENLNKFATP
ncbi:MAG: molecular chaperone HscB [Saprospiraceae bacterium]|jgi:molecular chaperone HscB